MRESTTRRLLVLGGHELHTPEYVFEEIDAHWSELRNRSGVPQDAFREALRILRAHMVEHDSQAYAPHSKDAERILNDLDMKDVPYVALALAIAADGIWTEDRDLRKQTAVRIVRTVDLVRGQSP